MRQVAKVIKESLDDAANVHLLRFNKVKLFYFHPTTNAPSFLPGANGRGAKS